MLFQLTVSTVNSLKVHKVIHQQTSQDQYKQTYLHCGHFNEGKRRSAEHMHEGGMLKEQ